MDSFGRRWSSILETCRAYRKWYISSMASEFCNFKYIATSTCFIGTQKIFVLCESLVYLRFYDNYINVVVMQRKK